MQNAKDSFYIALRNRLAVLDPSRVMTLRGVQRPGVLVEEAESPNAELPGSVFVLRWTAMAAMEQLQVPLMSLECELHYATAGSETNAGLDRGRAMSALDALVVAILQPLSTPKLNYTTTPATPMQTNVFWTEPILEPLQTVRDRLVRIVHLTVFAFEEAGEQ